MLEYFRPSTGNWYLETTKTGAVNRTFHFGTNGDKPTGTQIVTCPNHCTCYRLYL